MHEFQNSNDKAEDAWTACQAHDVENNHESPETKDDSFACVFLARDGRLPACTATIFPDLIGSRIQR